MAVEYTYFCAEGGGHRFTARQRMGMSEARCPTHGVVSRRKVPQVVGSYSAIRDFDDLKEKGGLRGNSFGDNVRTVVHEARAASERESGRRRGRTSI